MSSVLVTVSCDFCEERCHKASSLRLANQLKDLCHEKHNEKFEADMRAAREAGLITLEAEAAKSDDPITSDRIPTTPIPSASGQVSC